MEYSNFSAVSLSVSILMNGIPVSLDPYAPGAVIDGSEGTPPFQIVATILNPDLTVATTTDGILCSDIPMFRSSDVSQTNVAVLTLRKGFNPLYDTTYIVVVWYDSTGESSGGWRECDRNASFIVTGLNKNVSPPYLP